MGRSFRGNQGMTIVEILVVIGVMSIISILMYQILVDMQKENQRTLDEMQVVMALDTALEALSRDIESILPNADGKGSFLIRNKGKENEPRDEILFAVPVRIDESRIGRAERAYALQGEKGDCRLVQFEVSVPEGKVDTTKGRAMARVPKRFSLFFDVKWGKGPDGTWNDQWDEKDGLPERVRVTLTAVRREDPTGRPSEIKLGRTVYLMAM